MCLAKDCFAKFGGRHALFRDLAKLEGKQVGNLGLKDNGAKVNTLSNSASNSLTFVLKTEKGS